MTVLANLTTVIAVLGLLQCLAGWVAVRRFIRRPPTHDAAVYPPVTILRPLCGAEPLLEEALTSCFTQDYARYQIVFGVQDPGDPALAVLRTVTARFPDHDVAVVVDSTPHGPNRKVSNLINMMAASKHDVLVISDSDLHLPANYLTRLVVELAVPGTGMVTSLYAGLPPATGGLWERLGATQITHAFLPGVLLSRALGREDCLGSTTMLTRETLARAGGFPALVELLAEDNVLGQRVKNLGLSIRIADTVVAATVPEPSFRALWLHETRWTRTIRCTAPYDLAASVLQYPLFWVSLTVLLAGGAAWSAVFFLLAWLVRMVTIGGIDDALRRRLGGLLEPTPAWILPLRDVLSVAEVAASFCIDEVLWRGHKICATSGTRS